MMVDKECYAVLSALLCVVAGIVMSFLSLLTNERGTINDSVLWFLGQMLLYAGSVFGLKSYIDYHSRRQ